MWTWPAATRSCLRRYEFTDLQSFLDLLYANLAAVQTRSRTSATW